MLQEGTDGRQAGRYSTSFVKDVNWKERPGRVPLRHDGLSALDELSSCLLQAKGRACGCQLCTRGREAYSAKYVSSSFFCSLPPALACLPGLHHPATGRSLSSPAAS